MFLMDYLLKKIIWMYFITYNILHIILWLAFFLPDGFMYAKKSINDIKPQRVPGGWI